MQLLPMQLPTALTLLLLTSPALAQVSPSLPLSQGSAGRTGLARSSSPHPVHPAVLESQRIVGLELGADSELLASGLGAILGGTVGDGTTPHGLSGVAQVARLDFLSPAAAEVGEFLLERMPGVLFVEPNRPVGSPETCGVVSGAGTQQCTAAFFDSTPTAPEYVDQAAVPAIALDETTSAANGTSTFVAVIDTGIDFTHPLLVNHIAGAGYDFVLEQPVALDIADGVDSDFDGTVDEGYGHGTFVSGLIALVDPAVALLPYRVLDSEGVGNTWDVARAIERATLDGAEVINLSLSFGAPSAAVDAAIDFATDDSDVVFVGAAGNTGSFGVSYPAAYEDVIAVAAVDAGDVLAPFSAFGPSIDLTAPGVDLYSAMPGNLYASWSGTSMSAALVSGAMSRLYTFTAKESELEDSTGALLEAAFAIAQQNPGFDDFLGNGRIDVAGAGQALANDD